MNSRTGGSLETIFRSGRQRDAATCCTALMLRSMCNADVYPQVMLFGFRYSQRAWPRARDLKLACLTSTT